MTILTGAFIFSFTFILFLQCNRPHLYLAKHDVLLVLVKLRFHVPCINYVDVDYEVNLCMTWGGADWKKCTLHQICLVCGVIALRISGCVWRNMARVMEFLVHKGFSGHVTGEASPKWLRKWPKEPKMSRK